MNRHDIAIKIEVIERKLEMNYSDIKRFRKHICKSSRGIEKLSSYEDHLSCELLIDGTWLMGTCEEVSRMLEGRINYSLKQIELLKKERSNLLLEKDELEDLLSDRCDGYYPITYDECDIEYIILRDGFISGYKLE